MSAPGTTTHAAWRRPTRGRVAIAVVFAVLQVALAILGLTAWGGDADNAGFAVLFASAALGVPISLFLAWTNIAVLRHPGGGRGAAVAGLTAAVLRLIALAVTTWVVSSTVTTSDGESPDLTVLVFAFPEAVALAVLGMLTVNGVRRAGMYR
jgi:hypothetical protein